MLQRTIIFSVFLFLVVINTLFAETIYLFNSPPPKIKNFNELDYTISLYYKKILQEPNNKEHKYFLIELLFKKGDWESAEKICNEIITEDTLDIPSFLYLGKIYSRTHRYQLSEDTYLKTLNILSKYLWLTDNFLPKPDTSLVPLSLRKGRGEAYIHYLLKAKSHLGLLYIIKGESDNSMKIFSDILTMDSENVTSYLGLGSVYIERRKYDDAINMFKSSLVKTKCDYQDSSIAYNGISLAYLGKGILDSAFHNCQKAIAIDFFNSSAHTRLGYIYFRNGDISKMADEIRTALLCDPYNITAHAYFGNGMTDTNYEHYYKIDNNSQMPFYYELQKAKNFIDIGELEKAKSIYLEILKEDSLNFFSHLELGNIYWLQGDFYKSLHFFLKATKIRPDYGVAYNGFRVAVNSIRNRYRSDYTENRKLFDSQDIPTDVPLELVSQIFKDYNALPSDYQKSIILSIYPFIDYLPLLKSAGATHDILLLDERVTDNPLRQKYRGNRTADGRLWDDIRGMGGINSATGIENIEDAMNLLFNTLAHEFAHQIHQYALTDSEKSEIENLYANAKSQGKCLDYYAESNVLEYFAQGVEAYISLKKRRDALTTECHTRDELKIRDPDLYSFIEKIIAKKK